MVGLRLGKSAIVKQIKADSIVCDVRCCRSAPLILCNEPENADKFLHKNKYEIYKINRIWLEIVTTGTPAQKHDIPHHISLLLHEQNCSICLYLAHAISDTISRSMKRGILCLFLFESALIFN